MQPMSGVNSVAFRQNSLIGEISRHFPTILLNNLSQSLTLKYVEIRKLK